MSDRVVLHPDRVEKRQRPESARVEAEKLRCAAAIAARTGLFEVPAILEEDASEGRLVLARITDGVPLADALAPMPQALARVARVGAIAAVIHRDLVLDSPWASDAPDLGARTARVFVHGDLTLSNLLYRERADALVLLDWSTPAWLGGTGTRAPAFQDLGVFVASLFEHAGGRLGRSPDAPRLARAFLDAYTAALGEPLDRAAFARYFDAMSARWADAYRARRGSLRWAAHQPALARQRRFVRDLARRP